jgi:hypothetical protein
MKGNSTTVNLSLYERDYILPVTKSGNIANYFGLADKGINKWTTLKTGWQALSYIFLNIGKKIQVPCMCVCSYPSVGVESNKSEIVSEVGALTSFPKLGGCFIAI